MPASAVVMVAFAAVFHATWNLIAKRTGGGTSFLWLFGAAASILILPPAIWTLRRDHTHLGRVEIVACLVSGFIHIFYFWLLQAGYRDGDLSIVYPIARGVGPLISAFVGIAFLGDRPGPAAIAGGILLLSGVVAMSGISFRSMHLDRSVVFGLLCGVSIATYTIWDRRSVTTLHLPAVFYYWAQTLAFTVFITPVVARNTAAPWNQNFIRTYWRPAVLVALLSGASYSLVLHALTLAPLSYVATFRESSILVAAIYGVVLLDEPLTRRKLLAALAIFIGIVGLAIG